MQVADRWYATELFDDGVTLISEQHVDPGVACNIWHIAGRDRDVLIDSGLGVVPLSGTVAELTDRPVLAVASHTHFDHVGSLHEFDERLCHRAEAHILTTPNPQNTVWSAFRAMVPPEDSVTALPFTGFSFDDYKIRPAPPTQLIDEGDELDLGDRLLKVFHLPGHSPGSVALYEEATRTLFTGDVLYDGELLDSLYHSDADVYEETLARLREIPADTFHCGHHPSFGRARMHELIDAYLASRSSTGRKSGNG